MHADGGVNSGWGCETTDRAYGLNDPSLEGIFGKIFKVVSFPARTTFKVAKVAARTAVRVAPGAITGFIAGGPVGAIAGAGLRLLPRGAKNTSYTTTPIQTVGTQLYQRSNPALNPYGVEAQPYQGSQYQQPYQQPRRSVGDQMASMFNLLKDELLAAGARKVVETPAGREAVREKVSGDIGRYLLPISIGAGALMLTLVMVRR